ncbi:MAG: hypothetical protein K8J08_00300, partial [Thermoanaerobaculia bacterium]|nr:hypothetical protein [Thermoanaerobaculia bacterium]
MVLPVGAETLPRIRALSVEDGLSHNAVYSIVQDHRGLLWFGTEDGIDRFDGYNFKRFGLPSSGTGIGVRDVSYLMEDSDGTLWVGAWGGGLSRLDLDDGSVQTFSHDPNDPGSLPDNRVQQVFEDSGGGLWVATFRGLAYLAPGSSSFRIWRSVVGDPRSLSHDRVWWITEDGEGRLWVATNSGLNRMDASREYFVRYLPDPLDPTSLSHDLVRSLYVDSRERLWVGTEQGLNLYQPETNDFRQPRGVGDTMTVNALVETHDGQLWVGTQRSGLLRCDSEVRACSTLPGPMVDDEGLQHDDIRSLLEDRSGLLWVSTRGGGIAMVDLHPSEFEHFQHSPRRHDGLSHRQVLSVLETKSGDLWVGTVRGLTRFAPGGEVVQFFNDPDDTSSLASNRVQALAEARDGTLWIGTRLGLHRFVSDDSGFVRYRHDVSDPSSLASDRVETLLVDGSNRLWVGTEEGLDLLLGLGPPFRHLTRESGSEHALSDDFVVALFEDRKGSLWVGTDVGGLNFFDAETGTVSHYRHDPTRDDSLSNDRVEAIHQDRTGTIWVGTRGGLDRFDPETKTFSHFGRRHGFPSSAVHAIESDGLGRLWISSNEGLWSFDPATGRVLTFDTIDGLQGRIFSPGASFRSPKGFLYFGGLNGLNRFLPEDLEIDQRPPEVVLDSFRIMNQPGSAELPLGSVEKIALDYEDRFFYIDFVGLDFRRAERLQYAYTLEGFDSGWNYSGGLRRASYTNVPPGSYRFRVKAANADGVWSDADIGVDLTIASPVWATTWFKVLSVLLVLGTVALALRYRLRGLNRQKRQLAKLVEDRTAELKRASWEVEQKNEQLWIINNT